MNRGEGGAARERKLAQRQGCSVCKQQRKRCDESCEMAPYFPGNRHAEFQRAQKLYGLSNILKLMKSVDPSQRKDVAESILAEANARFANPAHGSFGIVNDLISQIQNTERELQLVNQRLAYFRQRGNPKQVQQDVAENEKLLQAPTFLQDVPDRKQKKVAEDGFHSYQATLEEGADDDDVLPSDINYPTMDYLSQFDQHALPNFNAPGDFRDQGKQAMNTGVAGGDAKDEGGPSRYGKEICEG